jgi:hypothetical protein
VACLQNFAAAGAAAIAAALEAGLDACTQATDSVSSVTGCRGSLC